MMRIAIRRSTRGILDSKSKAQASTKETDAEDVEKKPPPEEDPCPSACPICQESVGEPTADGITETWASLPCGHAFGSGCIKTWLAITDHPTCPICRLSMAHSCRHPVLPLLEPPPNRFGSNSAAARVAAPTPPPSSAAAASSSLLSSRSLYHQYLMPRGTVTAAAAATPPSPEKWRWQGRKLSGQCGFCASLRARPPLALRLAAAALKLALSRSRRGRRIVAMQPSMYYGESEHDHWRVAFRDWWSQQEPKLDEPPAPEVEASPAATTAGVVAGAEAEAEVETATPVATGQENQAALTTGVAAPVTTESYC
ncbi:hypothetical protein GGTG_07902 [Gaeumannomyces tritici R3-111a-1]|uniref:RING-type E3 ubiquitin transferase n=1 Tax=Gaeumannomyces tritici (strain R3-111a-1) TaxID=644352 RepID=J3P311_GAET3|nr:hypothetical protein GGTG_07902 [Gaeumannomyces tritici R3-111a-1]EJT74053.1 hypothetical protein GGTG_07902 [Gaeumannomyces tritici R3-111a-1]